MPVLPSRPGSLCRGPIDRSGPKCRLVALTALIVGSTLLPSAEAAAVEAEGSGEIAVTDGRYRPPAVESTTLDLRWSAWRLTESGSANEAQAWEAFRSTALELGLLNLPAHAAALQLEAAQEHASGHASRAQTLIERASELAPESAIPHFVAARRTAQSDPTAWIELGRQINDGYRALLRSFDGQRALHGLWRRAAVTAITLLCGLLTAAMLVRHAGRAVFDVRLLMLRAPTIGQTRVIVAMALATPAVLLGSPLLGLVCAGVLVAPYLVWKERLALAGAFAALVLVVPLAHESARGTVASTSPGRGVLAAMREPCDLQCQADLEARALTDDDAAVALAAVNFRYGTTDRLRRAEQLVATVQSGTAAAASADVLRGNLAALRGDLTAAERHFTDAAQRASDRRQQAAALYNLSRVYSEQHDMTAEGDALLLATQLDPDRVASVVEYRGRSQNRVWLVAALPAAALWQEALEEADPDAVTAVFTEQIRWWTGALPLEAGRTLPLAVVAWIALSALLGRARLVSIRCRNCAAPTHRFVYSTAFLDGRCVLCYQLAAIPAELSFAQRTARERRQADFEDLKDRGLWVATFAFPGGAALLRGQTVGGLTCVLVAVCGAVPLLVPSVVATLPYAPARSVVLDGRVVVAVMLLTLAWSLSLGIEFLARRSRR